MRRLASLLGIVLVGTGAVSGVGGAAGPEPVVTVIGDSVMTSVLWYSGPTAILEQNLDLRLQVAVCRRLTGPSCTFEGVTPPDLVQLVSQLERKLGPTVVVEMGYNDQEATFAQSVEESLAALRRVGVTRVLWLTLREARHPYVDMNAMLYAAAERHPELTVIDWNTYSRSHPEWFQNDFIHLVPAGGAALATFVHQAIVTALARPLPLLISPAVLPAARAGRAYSARLTASNGTPPYRFALAGGKLPAGLTLEPNGELAGRPRTAARDRLLVRVSDARARSVVQSETLIVAG